MNLNEFAKEVHQNAISHGWWGEEYTDAAAIALIHAEISEAFEEWRANRPMVYHMCTVDGEICEPEKCSYWIGNDCDAGSICEKPEGIAVELIDVVLRILDTAEAWDVEISEKEYYYTPDTIQEMELPELIVYLHYEASIIHRQTWYDGNPTGEHLSRIVTAILTWLRAHDIDPEPLMLEKHNYNKTRPYKHGGKRV